MSIRSKLCVSKIFRRISLLGGRQSVGEKTTLFVLNFAILVRKYFAGFYFRDFNAQI